MTYKGNFSKRLVVPLLFLLFNGAAIASTSPEVEVIPLESAVYTEDSAAVSEDLPTLGQSWNVSYSDVTIRQTLIRWADEAGWTFNNLHYGLPVDIPITAEATLVEKGSFKDAVQVLVDSIGMAGYPVRACFYNNDVLRLVGYNQSCHSRAN